MSTFQRTPGGLSRRPGRIVRAALVRAVAAALVLRMHAAVTPELALRLAGTGTRLEQSAPSHAAPGNVPRDLDLFLPRLLAGRVPTRQAEAVLRTPAVATYRVRLGPCHCCCWRQYSSSTSHGIQGRPRPSGLASSILTSTPSSSAGAQPHGRRLGLVQYGRQTRPVRERLRFQGRRRGFKAEHVFPPSPPLIGPPHHALPPSQCRECGAVAGRPSANPIHPSIHSFTIHPLTDWPARYLPGTTFRWDLFAFAPSLRDPLLVPRPVDVWDGVTSKSLGRPDKQSKALLPPD
ncbi:hypothetical protein CDD83_6560 [Cordyceps sp. RAO-2017]|nr:hypothetical protein CDD83_6560 [Cordyceps sp. RAO-2017]